MKLLAMWAIVSNVQPFSRSAVVGISIDRPFRDPGIARIRRNAAFYAQPDIFRVGVRGVCAKRSVEGRVGHFPEVGTRSEQGDVVVRIGRFRAKDCHAAHVIGDQHGVHVLHELSPERIPGTRIRINTAIVTGGYIGLVLHADGLRQADTRRLQRLEDFDIVRNIEGLIGANEVPAVDAPVIFPRGGRAPNRRDVVFPRHGFGQSRFAPPRRSSPTGSRPCCSA